MKKLLKNWLGITGLENRVWAESHQLSVAIVKNEELLKRIKELEAELGRSESYIGALYDYLEVRPKRTFVQDYSRLPEEAIPTREMLKAEKVTKQTAKKK